MGRWGVFEGGVGVGGEGRVGGEEGTRGWGNDVHAIGFAVEFGRQGSGGKGMWV